MADAGYEALEDLGRVRLPKNFFMRDFLYSETANHFQIRNMPDDVETAIRAGRHLCEELLEPIQEPSAACISALPSAPKRSTAFAASRVSIARQMSARAARISGTVPTPTAISARWPARAQCHPRATRRAWLDRVGERLLQLVSYPERLNP
jgi:hypothetical protein